MALGDIYRLTHSYRYGVLGPVSNNVYYYRQVTPGVNEGAEHLSGAWDTAFQTPIRGVQVALTGWLQVQVENIIPGPDFFVQPYDPVTVVGARSGEAMPPFSTWAFRLNRQSSASRNGQKRIGYISESDQNAGVAAGTILAALSTLAGLLDDVIGGPPPSDATYQPVIFRAGRPSVTIPEKIVPAVLQATFDIASVAYVSLSTQNTRKLTPGA